MVDRVQSPLGMLLVVPAFQRDMGRLTPWAAFVRERERVDALIYAEMKERREALASPGGEDRDDVLSLLLKARDEEGRAMTDVELRDELMTLLVAGYETTATALCWVFEKILSHPEVCARIVAEVDAAGVGSDPAVANERLKEQLARLEYVDAAIKEALRLRPVVPMIARKTKRPISLGGYEIPAETMVLPAAYATQRRADLYPDPETFRPERFLSKKPDPYTWFPFGGGVRRCLGMAFALYEMKVVVATVLSRVRLRLRKRAPLRVVLRGFSFAPEGGTAVVVEGRRAPLTTPLAPLERQAASNDSR
jgi:cytochrome P450